MSDKFIGTPKTDAEAIRFTEQFQTLPIYGVGLNFARALERENEALRDAAITLLDSRSEVVNDGLCLVPLSRLEALRAALHGSEPHRQRTI